MVKAVFPVKTRRNHWASDASLVGAGVGSNFQSHSQSDFSDYVQFSLRSWRGPTTHRKGATKDLLNTAKYDKGPDNPKPNPNLKSFVVA